MWVLKSRLCAYVIAHDPQEGSFKYCDSIRDSLKFSSYDKALMWLLEKTFINGRAPNGTYNASLKLVPIFQGGWEELPFDPDKEKLCGH